MVYGKNLPRSRTEASAAVCRIGCRKAISSTSCDVVDQLDLSAIEKVYEKESASRPTIRG